MNFKIGTKEAFAEAEKKVTKVEFYLKTNADGSVGLYINNTAFDPSVTNSELLSIDTDGVIRRRFFSAKGLGDPRIFMKYEYSTDGREVRVRVV